MSTLAEVLAEVLVVVPQPDKESLIRSRINATVNLISRSGYFWRDIEETTIGAAEGIDPLAYTQTISVTTAQRKFIYVKSSNTDEPPITLIDPEMVVKADCKAITPIAYLSGSSLHIKHTKLTDEFAISYYTSPTPFALNGDDDAETNWILDTVPELVVDIASAYILNLVGDSDDSKRISELATMLRGTYIRDFVDSHVSI